MSESLFDKSSDNMTKEETRVYLINFLKNINTYMKDVRDRLLEIDTNTPEGAKEFPRLAAWADILISIKQNARKEGILL